MTEKLKKAAVDYGMQAATNYFRGRKGHGGGPVGKVLLTQAELAAVLAIGYEAGAKNRTRLADEIITVEGVVARHARPVSLIENIGSLTGHEKARPLGEILREGE